MARNCPQVIIVDVKAGEATLSDGVVFEGIRHLAVEMHKTPIGLAGIDRSFAALRRQRFSFDPGSPDSTVVIFSRIGSDADVS